MELPTSINLTRMQHSHDGTTYDIVLATYIRSNPADPRGASLICEYSWLVL